MEGGSAGRGSARTARAPTEQPSPGRPGGRLLDARGPRRLETLLTPGQPPLDLPVGVAPLGDDRRPLRRPVERPPHPLVELGHVPAYLRLGGERVEAPVER